MKFDRFPVDRSNFGRVGTFGQGAASGARGLRDEYGNAALKNLEELEAAGLRGAAAVEDLFSPDGSEFLQNFRQATDAVGKLSGALDGSSGTTGNGGAEGGAAGAMRKLGEAAK